MLMVALLSVNLTACGDDDDDVAGGNSALVGTWIQQYGSIDVIGARLDANGNAYYNEWDINEDEVGDFSGMIAGKWSVSGNTITFTDPDGETGVYNFVLSDDGQTLTLSYVSGDLSYVSGSFTKFR